MKRGKCYGEIEQGYIRDIRSIMMSKREASEQQAQNQSADPYDLNPASIFLARIQDAFFHSVSQVNIQADDHPYD